MFCISIVILDHTGPENKVGMLMYTEDALANGHFQCPLYMSYEDVAIVFRNHVSHDPCSHGSDIKT